VFVLIVVETAPPLEFKNFPVADVEIKVTSFVSLTFSAVPATFSA
jgi:hypothetical protein